MRNTIVDLTYLSQQLAFPAGGATANGSTISDVARFGGQLLFAVDVPALPVGNLPNGESYTFNLISSNSQAFGSITSTTLMGKVTGAGGVGAAAQTLAAKVPANAGQYLTLQIIASASAVAPSSPANLYAAAY